MTVPADFPNLLGLSSEALEARYGDALEDVQRLAGYCVRKNVPRTAPALAERLGFFGVHPKTEHLTAAQAELTWVKTQVISLLSIREQK